MNDFYNSIGKFTGIYRGFVTWNDDPAVKGRLKIFVPGIYSDRYADKPELLPWACPAMSAFGGNTINPNATADNLLNDETGWSSPPHAGNAEVGAQVFVFFEGGDINYPIYFAFAQSGRGWLAEHPNQHVFKTDNIRIRIDENVKDDRSTCKFDSYNSKNSKVSKANLERDCIKHGWKFDQGDGIIKDLETRIDIEILAEDLNAVNLNIHGNVNMKLDGNWFIEHYGNKYEYHEGDTYIKQKGSTYIEQEGTVRIKHDGDKSVDHTGHDNTIHNGDIMETYNGSYFMLVNGDTTFNFNSEYKLKIGKNYTEMVGLSKSVDIAGSKTLNIHKSYNEVISDNKFISTEGFYDLLAGENITEKSNRGNIVLETEGNFELTKKGNITPIGFNNIGTKGNIQLISTFGNINIQCKKDDAKAQFNKKCISIPWNPSFVTQLEKMTMIYPSFNKFDSILGMESLNSSTDFSSFDISKFTQIFTESTTSLLIYDGLPVFLPTRMIVQNPNIPIPRSMNDVTWIPEFRSEALDWRDISISDYWKLPGRMMGNINIETWSGDISIKTNSELGCAGNITIEATESAGTLPGYKIGTVDIKNEANKRIYPDPRDLFLDSDFQARLGGQLKLFKHATGFSGSRASVLPSAADAILKGFTGCSFSWSGTNYNDFYKINGTAILTNGKGGALSPMALSALDKLTKKQGPKLGCPKCISDYLLGMPGIQDLCYATESFNKIGVEGFHSYGFFKYNPFDKENPRGTFNIDSTSDFDKISIGDGHAIDMGFIDKEYVGPNIGAFNLSSSGDFNHTIGRNYKFKCNTSTENGEKIVNYTYTEKWYDDVWPISFSVPFITLTNLFNQGISSVGGLNRTGDFTVSKISTVGLVKTSFKFLSTSLPHDKFTVIGYTVKEFNKTGNKLTKTYEEGFESSIDLGFDITNVLKVFQNPEEIMKRTMTFTDYVFTKNIIDNTTNIDKKVEEINRKFVLGLKDPYPLTINVKKSYFYDDIKVENSALNSTNYGDDNLHILSGVNEFNLKTSKSYKVPDINIKINDHCKRIVGHGYDKDTDYISYLEYKDDQAPISTYIDYMENELKSVVSDLPEHAGKPRNISSLIFVDSFRSNSEDITWTSAINKQTLNLISNGIFLDEIQGKEIAINNIKVNLLGNAVTAGKQVEKYNAIAYEAKDFPVNEIFINNGRITDNSLNKIELTNGYKSKSSTNELYVRNGSEAESTTNNYFFENGYSSKSSTNTFKFVNGLSGEQSANTIYVDSGSDANDTKNTFLILSGNKALNSVNTYAINTGETSNSSKNSFTINAGIQAQASTNSSISSFGISAPNSINSYETHLGSLGSQSTNSASFIMGDNTVQSQNTITIDAGNAGSTVINTIGLNFGNGAANGTNTFTVNAGNAGGTMSNTVGLNFGNGADNGTNTFTVNAGNAGSTMSNTVGLNFGNGTASSAANTFTFNTGNLGNTSTNSIGLSIGNGTKSSTTNIINIDEGNEALGTAINTFNINEGNICVTATNNFNINVGNTCTGGVNNYTVNFGCGSVSPNIMTINNGIGSPASTYSLNSNIIIESATMSYTMNTGGVGLISAGGAITVTSGGAATLGAATKDSPTMITGKFVASGHLDGDASNSTCHHSAGTPGSGMGGVAPTPLTLVAPVISAAPPPAAPTVPTVTIQSETPTPLSVTITEALKTYLKYLDNEFKYLINIFTNK